MTEPDDNRGRVRRQLVDSATNIIASPHLNLDAIDVGGLFISVGVAVLMKATDAHTAAEYLREFAERIDVPVRPS